MKKLVLIFGFTLLLGGLHAQLDASMSLDAMVDSFLNITAVLPESTLAGTDSIVLEESDHDQKRTMFLLRESDVLVRLNSLPIYTWSDEARHIKPLAPDFNKLFDSNNDKNTISLENVFGVSLAGIKALSQDLRHYDLLINDFQKSQDELNRKNRSLQRVIDKQRKEIDLLKRQMAEVLMKLAR